MAGEFSTSKLEARDLACWRGGRSVFSGLDFTLNSGEVLVVRGPNGSGKSSLMRQLAGFVPIAEGTLTWDANDGQILQNSLSYLGHMAAAKPYLSVAENLQLYAALGGAQEDLGAAASCWGLEDLMDLQARFLSEGQKRRVALARLMAVPRPLWLLDEPNAGLDQENLERLNSAIRIHVSEGGMVVMASHVACEGLPARELDILPFTKLTHHHGGEAA